MDAVINQVLQNCCISDSQHAGLYSVCGLALRLRDLYKWEKALDPWVEEDPSVILAWIGEKEEEWEKISGKEYGEISISGIRYDPFDVRGINAVLEPQGLFYGAGYVHNLKPSFFLARLEDKRQMDGYVVYRVGRELARDLVTVPALSQDDRIILRKESAQLFLWDQIFYVNKSGRLALGIALECYGIKDQDPKELRRNLSKIVLDEMERYLYHELGEIRDPHFDREIWQEVIAAFPHTPIELLARSVKDLLADTSKYGALRYITERRKTASLAFYVAFLGSFAKALFPKLIGAFQEFSLTRNWHVIENAIPIGRSTAKRHAEMICRIYRAGKAKGDMQWVENEINKRLLTPIGVFRKSRISGNS